MFLAKTGSQGNRTKSGKNRTKWEERKAIADAIVTRNDEGGALFAFYDVACASIKPSQPPFGRVI